MIVSFLWGAVVFQDPLKNVWLTILGMVLLVLGIIGIACCKPNEQKSSISKTPSTLNLLNPQSTVTLDENVMKGDVLDVVVKVEETTKPAENVEQGVKEEEKKEETHNPPSKATVDVSSKAVDLDTAESNAAVEKPKRPILTFLIGLFFAAFAG